jgi:putative NADH-flavin reductase
MRIAITGASGRTGTALAEAALSRRHEVVAVVREPSRMSVAVDRVAIADARDAAALATAIRGVDAVVTTVGTGPDAPNGIVTESVRATLDAMQRSGVHRLVMVSATGPFTEGDAPLLRYVLKPIVQKILRAPFTDIAAADALVQASPLDWTIVRPPQLSDGAATTYRRNPRWGLRVTRATLAEAILDELDDPTSVRRVLAIAR